MILSVVFILFFMIGSVSAMDINNATDDSNLLDENNFYSQNLEVSSYNSISETISHDEGDNYSSNGDADLLTSQYISDDIFQANETISTSLTGNDTELYFKNGTAFKIVLSDVNGTVLTNQNIVFTINGNSYNRTTDDNGVASIRINLNPGSYNITSFYAGSGSYESSSATNIVKVLSTISGEDIEKYYRNDTQYYATFVDGQGNLLNNTTVTYNINGVFYERKTDENGKARLNINLAAGDYILTATNPVNGEMYSNYITVLTTVFGDDIVKYYKNDTQYYISVVNATGSPLTNENVTFNINGVYYTRTTNESGIAKININLNPGNYTITATNPINGEMHSNNIEVLPTIFADDLNMTYRDGSKFSAYILDGAGNALVNSTVTFNINGVFYNRTSDSEGKAYLNINLNIGSYIITATNEKGLSVSNNITINKCNSTIEGNDAYIILGTDRNFTVTLTGLNNKSIPSVAVDFAYAGINVTAVTDDNGQATIALANLSEGRYTISYSFAGNMNYYSSQSNNSLVVANSTVILTGDDLNMIYKDGSKFNVTLTDLNLNPLANETITFTLNGVDYNRTTDDNGVAGLNINLIPGTYSISYSYSEIDEPDYNAGSNTITVSKLPATLTAEDLSMEYGDSASFIVTLTNSSNSTISDAIVTFNINGVSYNRTTNSSGVAKIKIGLGVGYYTITTSLDNVIYSADEITNHILVDGFILTSEEMTMVAGTTSDFDVSLTDAYGNGISNATIAFDYNGISTSAITGSDGVASISISGLDKGDYLIVYNYTAGNIAGQSYIHVIGTISISDLVAAANTVNSYIESNAKLPTTVAIGDTTYSAAQYLYLVSQAIIAINNGDFSNLYVLDINDPTSPGAASNMGSLSDYLSLAGTMLTGMANGTTPNSVSTSLGTIGYDGIFYALTRVIVYYGLMDTLPSSVSVKSLTLYTSQSVLDSANTITNLSPYLSASTNCQVSNAAIVALAESLTKGITNSLDKAVAIYNYVRDSISYSFYYDTKYGAVGTLNAKTGNCVDQAHLLIALYRAAGLPARYVHGTCVFSSGNTYGHVWAQVLIGDTWVVSDTTSTRNSFGKVVNWNNYNYSLKGYYSSISF